MNHNRRNPRLKQPLSTEELEDLGKAIAESPALLNPEWLPADLDEGLTEYREKHVAALERAGDERARIFALAIKFKAEYEQLVDAYRSNGEAPKRTEAEERARQLAEARAKANAAMLALREVVEETLAYIKDHEDEWSARLEDRIAAADEAGRRLGGFGGMQESRVAHFHPDRHVQ